MTELDFEELDKAVSDLMKDTDAEPTSPTEPSSPVPPATAQPVSPAPQPAVPTTSDAPTAPAPVVRNRGRFMDVKATPGAVLPPKPTMPSREAATVTPPESAETVSTPPESSVEVVVETERSEEPREMPSIGEYATNPTPSSDESTPEAAKQDETLEEVPPVNSFSMPDPIDVAMSAEKAPEEELSSVITPVPVTVTKSEPSPEGTEGVLTPETDPAADSPSPFIADAKVEKRPLGGAGSDTGDDTAGEPAEQNIDTSAPLPRELSNDLMNLETDGNDVAEGKPVGDAPAQPVVAPQGSQPAQAAPAASAAPVNTIFDTAGYHNAPLTPPAKKKRGWMIIVWILVLLIVGACAGAAYFYFTTQ